MAVYDLSQIPASAIERFWSYVDRKGDGECWPWLASVNHHRMGYGIFALTPKNSVSAHRAAFVLANGGIDKGSFVLHSCDNPPCCNPAHLYAGDHEQNMADRAIRGRLPSQRGAKNNNAKLTDEQMREIAMSDEHWSLVAPRYGISKPTFYRVRRNYAGA